MALSSLTLAKHGRPGPTCGAPFCRRGAAINTGTRIIMDTATATITYAATNTPEAGSSEGMVDDAFGN